MEVEVRRRKIWRWRRKRVSYCFALLLDVCRRARDSAQAGQAVRRHWRWPGSQSSINGRWSGGAYLAGYYSGGVRYQWRSVGVDLLAGEDGERGAESAQLGVAGGWGICIGGSSKTQAATSRGKARGEERLAKLGKAQATRYCCHPATSTAAWWIVAKKDGVDG